MNRRKFLQAGALTAITASVTSPLRVVGNSSKRKKDTFGSARNIIFLVSDGMSVGTLTMADLFLQRREGKTTQWLDLYRQNRVSRALMDTASADSMVTDSAAASSAWGGGVRIENGSINVAADGTEYKPILQKFKEWGKATGCVTTVPITHATPAGFCVNSKSRHNQAGIAESYLKQSFDVMMGGGLEYFTSDKRTDGRDLLNDFHMKGFQVAKNKLEMQNAGNSKPLLGVFYENGLPYTLDQLSDTGLQNTIPTLAEMTTKAISLMEKNPEGFVLQVEGGKVDWAAHANDTLALIHDQLAFDEAVRVAIEFAENRDDTLVIITTDHGNSNPGLLKSEGVNAKFDTLLTAKHTNEWLLHGISKNDSPARIVERIQEAQGIIISQEEAKHILSDYQSLNNQGSYNDYKLPFRKLAEIQTKYTGVSWLGMDHTADFVELAMFGPGSDQLKPFVMNTDLHYFMLDSCGMGEMFARA